MTFDADIFTRPFDVPLTDDEFNDHARRAFALQFARNPAYAAYCDRRGRTPATVTHWTQIPAVPTAAFKAVPLVAGDPAAAQAVFRTSGTTQGAEQRGTHYILDIAQYHSALVPAFAACLLPDTTHMRILSLVPHADEVADSSLSHMVAVVMDRLGDEGSEWFASVEHGIDTARLSDALHAAVRDDVPVCILGTSLAFLHVLDGIGHTFALPYGSRLMDTGGYKGRARDVAAADMYARYRAVLGIPASHCINEYGMTEMCSQFYDSALRDLVLGRVRERCKIAPPWVRTRVVHPETLELVIDGDIGILQHFDLANTGSVMAIQTEDLGVAVEGGFHLLGRAAGATPRGCSIAMDMLLEAVAARRP